MFYRVRYGFNPWGSHFGIGPRLQIGARGFRLGRRETRNRPIVDIATRRGWPVSNIGTGRFEIEADIPCGRSPSVGRCGKLAVERRSSDLEAVFEVLWESDCARDGHPSLTG